MRWLWALFSIWSMWGLALAASVQLSGIRHEYQRYNNCGPVTIGMAMSYFGSSLNQYSIAPVLKPNRQDKNVSPDEMAAFARSKGFGVHLGVAGDLALLRRLLDAGFPVIVETWFVVADSGGMGHYRLLVGYDHNAGLFRAFDSFYGPKVTLRYGEFDRLWKGFNRTYLVVYSQERQAALQNLLGPRWQKAHELALAEQTALRESQTNPNDTFAWFNLGSTKLAQGHSQAAAAAFDKARQTPPDRTLDPTRSQSIAGWPWRMLWYQFGPYEAYYAQKRYREVIALANEVLAKVGDLEESLFWRARAYAALGQTEAAKRDLRQALQFRPTYNAARTALGQLD